MSKFKIVIDPVQLGKLAELCCSHEEVAAYFRCSVTTIKHRLKRDPLKSVWEVGLARGRISLRRAQLQAAHNGDRTMLVWLGKQLLGQVDKVEQVQNQDKRWVVHLPPPMSAEEWVQAYGKGGDDAVDISEPKPKRPPGRPRKQAKIIDADNYTTVELP